LRRTWRLACLRAGIDPKAATALPLLFALDDRLAISDGFRYALHCTHLAAASSATHCASHIGCGGGCGGGCSGSGCSGSGCSGGGDGGGCGGGGGD
jgi:hypothetical protein